MHDNKKTIKIATQIIVTVLLFFFLFKQINVNELKSLIVNIKLSTIILGLMLYALMYVLRTFRFKILLSKPIEFWGVFNILLVHGFFNRALPLRLGEASYIYLMKDIYSIDIGESTFSIIYVRLYDVFSTIATFILFSLIVFNMFSNVYLYIFIFIVLLLLILGFPKILRWLHLLVSKKKLPNFITKFISKEKILYSLENTFNLNKKANTINNIFKLLSLSLGIWTCLYMIFYLLMLDFGYDIRFSEVILGSTFSNLTSILPISSLGNFGTMEVGWVMGFVLMGYQKDIAIMTGFTVNLFTFMSIILLGIIGILVLWFRKKNMISIALRGDNDENRRCYKK